MDLKKIIRGQHESLFYSSSEEVVNQKACVLLGYKDGIPVLANKTIASKSPTNAVSKQTLRVEVDTKTGKKYINLNGKKLRMVAGSELPAHLKQGAQVIKAAPGNVPSDKKTVKIKIIGSFPKIFQGATRPENDDADAANLKANVNKTDNGINVQLSHKPVLIRDSHPTPTKIPSTDKLATRDNTTVGNNSAKAAPENDRHLKANIISCSGGVLKSLNGMLKMNPLDLSKVGSKVDTTKAEVIKLDKSVQTSLETRDECLQTDLEDEMLLNMINMEFVDLINSPTVAPVKTATPKMVDAVTEAYSEKFRMFFQDLRAAMIPDVNGNRPIHVGVLNNDIAYLKRCCSVLKALQTSVDIPNHGDLTALQLAVINNASPQIVKILLVHGASLEAVDSEGNNVIHLAIECTKTEMLDTLLRFADEQKFNLNEFNAEGLTPLMICCCNGLLQCADLLLKYDADVNVRDRKSGRTALFHAAENHYYDLVQLLLSYNADTKIKNFFGTSPHDAMYEVEEIPENIKSAILGKSAKRKNVEEPKILKVRRVEENMNKLKTYARYKKVDYEFPANFATKAK